MKSFKNFDVYTSMEKKELQLVALVPHHGAEFEETLIFTDEETAMTYWRALPRGDCVSYIKLYKDEFSDAWVLS